MKSIGLITTEELAAMCHVAPSTVRFWRHINAGPKHFQLTGRRVFYRPEDVEEWIDHQYRQAHPGPQAG